ncbi:MAG: inositol monophosphatase [Actinomycetota bacterium]
MSEDVLSLLDQTADHTAAQLADNAEWGLVGRDHAAQYAHDLVADAAVLEVLGGSGVRVLSEESGWSGPEDAEVTVIVDPVDGSTNASLGIPHWVVSLCAVDGEGPVASVVLNPSNGERYRAIRGGGATLGDAPITPSTKTKLSESIVGLTGRPSGSQRWAQFRALGAAALDICYVAAGRLDAMYGSYGLSIWDYAGAMHVCMEAGAPIGEKKDIALFDVSIEGRRQVLAAGTQPVLDELKRSV